MLHPLHLERFERVEQSVPLEMETIPEDRDGKMVVESFPDVQGRCEGIENNYREPRMAPNQEEEMGAKGTEDSHDQVLDGQRPVAAGSHFHLVHAMDFADGDDGGEDVVD